ncbi:hypothetical protein ACJ65_11995, partial [Kocuria rhizophila]
MGMWFPHLHVASAFSAHYGVARPEELAETAAGQDAQVLACTDRDGLYGAVKHVLACRAHGITPVLGVDLALLGATPPRSSEGQGVRGPGTARGASPGGGAPRRDTASRGRSASRRVAPPSG